MMGRIAMAAALCWLVLGAGQLQAQEPLLSVLVKGNLTTSSLLYPNPNSADELARSQSYSIDSFFGYGVELRYRFPETNLAVGLSADYLHATSSRTIKANPLTVPVQDGYRVIPLELTGYFLIPVAGPTVGIFMGGGIGAYYGKREYAVGGQDAPSIREQPGFGIHVLGGLSYRVTPRFTLVGEMKFRDVQFEGTNQFSAGRVNYQGTIVNVGRDPFDFSVHTDGIVFQLGAAVTF